MHFSIDQSQQRRFCQLLDLFNDWSATIALTMMMLSLVTCTSLYVHSQHSELTVISQCDITQSDYSDPHCEESCACKCFNNHGTSKTHQWCYCQKCRKRVCLCCGAKDHNIHNHHAIVSVINSEVPLESGSSLARNCIQVKLQWIPVNYFTAVVHVLHNKTCNINKKALHGRKNNTIIIEDTYMRSRRYSRFIKTRLKKLQAIEKVHHNTKGFSYCECNTFAAELVFLFTIKLFPSNSSCNVLLLFLTAQHNFHLLSTPIISLFAPFNLSNHSVMRSMVYNKTSYVTFQLQFKFRSIYKMKWIKDVKNLNQHINTNVFGIFFDTVRPESYFKRRSLAIKEAVQIITQNFLKFSINSTKIDWSAWFNDTDRLKFQLGNNSLALSDSFQRQSHFPLTIVIFVIELILLTNIFDAPSEVLHCNMNKILDSEEDSDISLYVRNFGIDYQNRGLNVSCCKGKDKAIDVFDKHNSTSFRTFNCSIESGWHCNSSISFEMSFATKFDQQMKWYRKQEFKGEVTRQCISQFSCHFSLFRQWGFDQYEHIITPFMANQVFSCKPISLGIQWLEITPVGFIEWSKRIYVLKLSFSINSRTICKCINKGLSLKRGTEQLPTNIEVENTVKKAEKRSTSLPQTEMENMHKAKVQKVKGENLEGADNYVNRFVINGLEVVTKGFQKSCSEKNKYNSFVTHTAMEIDCNLLNPQCFNIFIERLGLLNVAESSHLLLKGTRNQISYWLGFSSKPYSTCFSFWKLQELYWFKQYTFMVPVLASLMSKDLLSHHNPHIYETENYGNERLHNDIEKSSVYHKRNIFNIFKYLQAFVMIILILNAGFLAELYFIVHQDWSTESATNSGEDFVYAKNDGVMKHDVFLKCHDTRHVLPYTPTKNFNKISIDDEVFHGISRHWYEFELCSEQCQNVSSIYKICPIDFLKFSNSNIFMRHFTVKVKKWSSNGIVSAWKFKGIQMFEVFPLHTCFKCIHFIKCSLKVAATNTGVEINCSDIQSQTDVAINQKLVVSVTKIPPCQYESGVEMVVTKNSQLIQSTESDATRPAGKGSGSHASPPKNDQQQKSFVSTEIDGRHIGAVKRQEAANTEEKRSTLGIVPSLIQDSDQLDHDCLPDCRHKNEKTKFHGDGQLMIKPEGLSVTEDQNQQQAKVLPEFDVTSIATGKAVKDEIQGRSHLPPATNLLGFTGQDCAQDGGHKTEAKQNHRGSPLMIINEGLLYTCDQSQQCATVISTKGVNEKLDATSKLKVYARKDGPPESLPNLKSNHHASFLTNTDLKAATSATSTLAVKAIKDGPREASPFLQSSVPIDNLLAVNATVSGISQDVVKDGRGTLGATPSVFLQPPTLGDSAHHQSVVNPSALWNPQSTGPQLIKTIPEETNQLPRVGLQYSVLYDTNSQDVVPIARDEKSGGGIAKQRDDKGHQTRHKESPRHLQQGYSIAANKAAKGTQKPTYPKRCCIVAGNKTFALDPNLLAHPHMDTYFVKERTETRPGHFLARLVLHHVYLDK